MSEKKQVVVIGAGPAGMMAAITAAEQGAAVTLVERNQKVGRKLYITGKGRCNVTNHCPWEEVLQNVPRNGRFLYSALSAWPPAQTEAFFEGLGVSLKVERGNRVFPVSDRAADIVDALYFRLKRLNVKLITGTVEQILWPEGRVTGVRLAGGRVLPTQAVVVATGGVSYPLTGSTGDGYRFAQEAGHTVVPPRPSLIPLVEDGDTCARMQGLALKNVELNIRNGKKKVVYSEFGELLFTHFGLSGPVILSASAHLKDFDKNRFTVIIDLKPALDEAKLDARILREFGENPNRDFRNVLGHLVPNLMVPVMVERSGIPGDTKVNSVTKGQRRRLVEQLKGFSIPIAGPRPVEEAIVTSGGVKVSEVDPATMSSKKMPGLYFAGEVLDVDAYTGGFNLQIAWATGRAAGNGICREIA
ncbi:MAG: NAD(P)/FAD-dependent oxidoreductase [Oscillospiraceae bacterium]|nr:NAD(P)/FAD-dependent oxidoreductase [Oscillospiraceae bacterium]